MFLTQNVPEQNVPEQNVPEQNVLEQNVPEQNVQENIRAKESGSNSRLKKKTAQFYSGDQGECNWRSIWKV